MNRKLIVGLILVNGGILYYQQYKINRTLILLDRLANSVGSICNYLEQGEYDKEFVELIEHFDE